MTLSKFDPYQVFYAGGSVALKTELTKLSFEELKTVLVKYTSIRSRKSADKCAHSEIVDVIVRDVKTRATRGQEFGDYKLPD